MSRIGAPRPVNFFRLQAHPQLKDRPRGSPSSHIVLANSRSAGQVEIGAKDHNRPSFARNAHPPRLLQYNHLQPPGRHHSASNVRASACLGFVCRSAMLQRSLG
ncbi:hypothetical protein PGTUg99_011251 [Puccinia graminis f. sp. tritici]|uniref:Uncharacterized protein n=1 Tax=Puccinia graminis f. sp. tritici TaxID=56615 RepID=A0A5B0RSN4_PUCGR|nr:hypothetical protein PGTUg99_011251 [Puccinia graminis f. sp. tritici]